ncbi:MAG TPA: hypothetical protein VFQ35_02755, partial [Polyangiaceae bacterium]|nr:hypothetical protein [Polyangiaceae bacterium]
VTCLAELPTSMTGSARGVTTRFDISSSEYPLASPTAMVVSSAKPFCTHVSPDSGGVCLGGLWRTLQGKELLAELVLRVFQAFNHQDPNTSEPGYQPHARALRERLNGRPFNPKFVLPAVPDDVFHDDGPRVVRARVTIVGMPARASGSRVQLPSSVRPRIRIVSGGGL